VLAGIDQVTGKAAKLHIPLQARWPHCDRAAVRSQARPISCTGEQTTVGPIISSELIQQAVLLILLGSVGILIWIGVRFHSIKFGATALAALVHDVIVVVGLFAIMGDRVRVQIDALFVTPC